MHFVSLMFLTVVGERLSQASHDSSDPALPMENGGSSGDIFAKANPGLDYSGYPSINTDYQKELEASVDSTLLPPADSVPITNGYASAIIPISENLIDTANSDQAMDEPFRLADMGNPWDTFPPSRWAECPPEEGGKEVNQHAPKKPRFRKLACCEAYLMSKYRKCYWWTSLWAARWTCDYFACCFHKEGHPQTPGDDCIQPVRQKKPQQHPIPLRDHLPGTEVPQVNENGDPVDNNLAPLPFHDAPAAAPGTPLVEPLYGVPW